MYIEGTLMSKSRKIAIKQLLWIANLKSLLSTVDNIKTVTLACKLEMNFCYLP